MLCLLISHWEILVYFSFLWKGQMVGSRIETFYPLHFQLLLPHGESYFHSQFETVQPKRRTKKIWILNWTDLAVAGSFQPLYWKKKPWKHDFVLKHWCFEIKVGIQYFFLPDVYFQPEYHYFSCLFSEVVCMSFKV